MQSSIVAIWLANLPYRQSTDNAVSVNAMVTHWKNRFIWRRYCRKNNQWFGMVCTLTDNDIRQNSGQNCRFVKWTWCKEIQFADVSEQSLNSCSLFIIYESVKKKNTTNKLNYTKLQYCCHSKKKGKKIGKKPNRNWFAHKTTLWRYARCLNNFHEKKENSTSFENRVLFIDFKRFQKLEGKVYRLKPYTYAQELIFLVMPGAH